MRTVTFSDAIVSIGEQAFANCTSMLNVQFPSGLRVFGEGAFYNCVSLTSAIIPNNVEAIPNSLFVGCSLLSSVSFPQSIKSIGSNAFADCKALKTISLPNSLQSIGGNAFLNCELINSVILPASLKSLSGFGGCTSLTSIIIPESVTVIGNDAFKNCSLTSVVIPKNVTTIGSSAFANCPLTCINFPESLTKIGDKAFAGCTSLTSSIEIPENVATIGDGAFFGCPVKKVTFSGNSKLTAIEDSTFQNTAIEMIEVPQNVTLIGPCAFAQCTSLKTAVLPEGLTKIRYEAFKGCSSLISIAIPSSVTYLESEVFQDCTSLRKVNLPEGIDSLFAYTFWNCKSLTSIVIPVGVNKIGYAAFSGTNLSRIVLLGGPGTADDNQIFNRIPSVKVYYPADKPWAHQDLENVTWIPYTELFSVEYKMSAEESAWYSEYAVDGEEYPVFPDEPFKARCEFVGWSKTPNATTAQYVAGDTITITEDKVLYPVWKKITPPAEVKNLKAAPAGKERVTLTWTASSGAEGYLVYGQKNGKYGYVGMTSGTTFTDTKALYNDYNFYWVFPYVKDELGNMIPRSCTKYVYAKGILTAVTGLKASSVTGGVKLTWNAVTGANGYLVYGIVDGKPYGYVGMTTKGTTFTDKTASKTQYNYYWVFPYFKDGSGKMIVGQTAKYTYGRAL